MYEIQHKITSLIKTRRVFVLFCDLVVLFVKANFVDGSVVLQDLKAGHGWMWTCEGRRNGWDCQRGRLRRVGKNPYDRLSSVGGGDVSASPVHPGIAFTRNHSDRHLYPDLGVTPLFPMGPDPHPQVTQFMMQAPTRGRTGRDSQMVKQELSLVPLPRPATS